MPAVQKDPAREERISMEIIVDAYGPEEQALGGIGIIGSHAVMNYNETANLPYPWWRSGD